MSSRPAAGFTLIELMIAGAIGVTVLAAGTAVLVKTAESTRRARDVADMRRSAAMLFEVLGTELRTAGLGVPSGARKANGDRFPPRVYKATTTEIDFIADEPRPDTG